MNCRRARKLIYEFIDGFADERVRVELDRHLGECSECERLANQLTRSMELIRRAPVETLDENFNWKVRLAIHRERNAIRDALASQGTLFRSWNIRYAASAAAGFVVAVALAWWAVGTGTVSWDGGGGVLTQAPSGGAVAEDASESSRVTATESPFMTRSPASPVSEGVYGPFRRTSGPRQGAITSSAAGIDLDSLIHAQMMALPESERAEFLRKRIEFINTHLMERRR
jgi:anti-sigma factor RsiW